MSYPNASPSVLGGPAPAHFSTAFGSRPRMIKLMRSFVSDFHDGVVLGAPRPGRAASPWASQLSMAAHELMENAMTYGPGDLTKFSISIDPDPEEPERRYRVCIKTRNRAAPHQREVVHRLLHALNEAEDPLEYYLELMADTARRIEGSGLGLARVRVEADMEVTCAVHGEELEIVAQARIERNPGGCR